MIIIQLFRSMTLVDPPHKLRTLLCPSSITCFENTCIRRISITLPSPKRETRILAVPTLRYRHGPPFCLMLEHCRLSHPGLCQMPTELRLVRTSKSKFAKVYTNHLPIGRDGMDFSVISLHKLYRFKDAIVIGVASRRWKSSHIGYVRRQRRQMK